MSASNDASNDKTVWTELMKRELVLGVLHFKCHTKDASKKAMKWDQLLIELRKNNLFIDEVGFCKLKIKNGDGLKTAFKRFQATDLAYIINPTMNLSGMPASKSEYQLLMEQVYNEEANEKGLKKQKKEFNNFKNAFQQKTQRFRDVPKLQTWLGETVAPKNFKLEKEKIKEQKLKNEILKLKKRKLQVEISKIEAANNISFKSDSDSDSATESDD